MKAYEIVTNEILKALDSGVIPWRMSWSAGRPMSMGSKKEYRGINLFVLSSKARSSRYWITYREAQNLGGQVRKGERATPVIYWHWRTEEEIAKLIATGKTNNPAPCVPFISYVFNLEQVENLERPADDVRPSTDKYLGQAEEIVKGLKNGPQIIYGACFVPGYSKRYDRIEMPFRSQFESADHFFLTLYHELIHSTGHGSRLDRFSAEGEGRAGETYSFEELVAEFGAAYLASVAGLDNSLRVSDSAAYINGWAKAFRSDSTVILRASAAAQRAADYILCSRAEESVPAAPCAVAATI